MSRYANTAIVAAFGLLTSASVAHAQFFNFQTTFSPDPVTSSLPGSQVNVINGFSNTGLYASDTFANDIVLTNFTTSSSAGGTTGGIVSTPYNIALTLTPASKTGIQALSAVGVTENFTGFLSGHVSANSALLTNQFTGNTTQTFDLGGGQVYQVELTSFTSPSAPGDSGEGAISARVFGPHVGGIGTTSAPDTPEPGTLAMVAAAGIPGSIFMARRRRRQA